jgi:hypothetical protein
VIAKQTLYGYNKHKIRHGGAAMPNQEIEKIINQTSGSFAVDGMIMSQEQEDRGRRYLYGKITMEEAQAEIDAKYGLLKVHPI